MILALGVVSCSSEKEEITIYETVNYATISGTWMLTELNGKPLEEGQYVYISFDRKEHTFTMYDNMSSMYSHKSTGVFNISLDDELGYILTGEYDFSHDLINEYIVSEMTESTMKWTMKDNPEDISIYTRCSEVPEEILSGSKSR